MRGNTTAHRDAGEVRQEGDCGGSQEAGVAAAGNTSEWRDVPSRVDRVCESMSAMLVSLLK